MAGQPTPAVPYLRGARAVKDSGQKGGQNCWSKLVVKKVVKKVVKLVVKISGQN